MNSYNIDRYPVTVDSRISTDFVATSAFHGVAEGESFSSLTDLSSDFTLEWHHWPDLDRGNELDPLELIERCLEMNASKIAVSFCNSRDNEVVEEAKIESWCCRASNSGGVGQWMGVDSAGSMAK